MRSGAERCASCGAVVSPPVEGSLAPVPRPLTPPPRRRSQPERAGSPAHEPAWRDEVRQRVRSRQKKRAAAGLPLFEQPEAGEGAAGTPGPAGAATVEPAPETRPPRLSEAELADLPLHVEAPAEGEAPGLRRTGVDRAPAAVTPSEPVVAAEEGELPVELRAQEAEAAAVERPARPAERAQAALLDLGLLTALATVVAYFSSRAARVELLGLLPSWPWLAGYLVFLGLVYAAYFTGTTGQTPGKMITRLRVLDAADRPPGYLRALLRALLGAVGTLAAGAGLLPMAFDPASRALHDRLMRTRVVRR